MTCYYNDSEPFVCAWLKNLIAAGHLPAGDVDERPIQEVTPDDVRGGGLFMVYRETEVMFARNEQERQTSRTRVPECHIDSECSLKHTLRSGEYMVFDLASPAAAREPSQAAIEAAKQCYHVEDWDFLNGDTAERVLRAAYAIDTPPCALTPSQRAAILMAILDLEAAADELDRPQAEWRWDELRRVRIALEYLRPVAPPDDPDKPFRDSWRYTPPRALSVEQLAKLLEECPDLWTAGDTDAMDREVYAQAAAWLLPRLLGPGPAKDAR